MKQGVNCGQTDLIYWLSAVLISCFGLVSAPSFAASSLAEALTLEHRLESTARDTFRHPTETLEFFDVKPDQTVIEIWPGGGWYTEILAPYLRDAGKLYAAHFDPEADKEYFQKSRQKFLKKLEAKPELYKKVEVTAFATNKPFEIAPAASADRVLTFRNLHNWYMNDQQDEGVKTAFKAFYKALKPGGILGVVEHRLPKSRPESAQDKSGYMHQDYVIRMAKAAGFKLVASSEINANKQDTTDYAEGVWSLPPSLRGDPAHQVRFQAIGESDRMTLKFMKPNKAE